VQQGKKGKRRRRLVRRVRAFRFGILGCRLAILPTVWWALFGFRGLSGVQQLKDGLGLGATGAAGLVSLFLAAMATIALLPLNQARRTAPTGLSDQAEAP
jgi:hypothetical protein